MPQSDLSSFFPLSFLFIFTFLLPIFVEVNFTDNDLLDLIPDLNTTNVRKATMVG